MGKSSAMVVEGKKTNFILYFRGFTRDNLVHAAITCHLVKVLVFHNLFFIILVENKVFPFLSDNVLRPIIYIYTLCHEWAKCVNIVFIFGDSSIPCSAPIQIAVTNFYTHFILRF